MERGIEIQRQNSRMSVIRNKKGRVFRVIEKRSKSQRIRSKKAGIIRLEEIIGSIYGAKLLKKSREKRET